MKGLSYFVIGSAKIEKDNQVRYANVVGIPLDRTNLWAETGFIDAEFGKILKKGDSGKVDIGAQYYHNNIFEDPVMVGDKIIIQGKSFKVKSNLKTLGNPPDDKIIYMSVKDFRETFPDKGEDIDQITVQVNEGADINRIVEKVKKKLDDARDVDDDSRDYRISTPEELLGNYWKCVEYNSRIFIRSSRDIFVSWRYWDYKYHVYFRIRKKKKRLEF